MSQLRILIADDHPVFRHGIRALLESTSGLEVLGEATTGDEAVALAEQLQPDLILMDIKMPGLNGVEATRRIMQSNPDARVLVVTMFEDNASVFPAMRAGARGYVLKDASKEEFLRAIQAVGNGEAIFSPSIATRLISFFTSPRAGLAGLSGHQLAFPQLTDREHEILDLIASGAPNHEIAERLSLTTKTVNNYVSNIFNKLQVAGRSEAIIKARDAGLG